MRFLLRAQAPAFSDREDRRRYETALSYRKCDVTKLHSPERLKRLRELLSDADICLLGKWEELQDEHLEYVPKALDNRDLWILMEAAGDIQRELAKNPYLYVGRRGDSIGYISEKLQRLNDFAIGSFPIREKEYWK